MSEINSEVVNLRDGSQGTIFFWANKEASTLIPNEIVSQLLTIFNDVIEEGLTYPYVDLVKDLNEMRVTWMSYACAILVEGVHEALTKDLVVLGTHYVKPNYPGRCSRNCNAGFLVSGKSRGKGVGRLLGEFYVRWAPKLGYRYSVFNLVFETNVASWKLWDSLGFDRIGLVPGAADLKGIDYPVNAIIYGKKLG